MNPAIHKTVALLLLIFIGLLLKFKVKGKDQLGGIKTLILSIALPATIFVALLKINIEPSLLLLPVLALAFNLSMLAATRFIFVPVFGIEPSSTSSRTLMMLMPSLAPGLSCFPFIIEYLGNDSLARAALADVGNKVFGLILLYMLAMRWYYRLNKEVQTGKGMKDKIKDLLISLIKEPINMVIIAAITLLCLGLDLASLPPFLQDAALRLSALTTALVLLFIGMAVRFRWSEFRLIVNLLIFRSGLAFCVSAVLLFLAPALSPAILLVAVVFPQSACSFWPFAHMSAVDVLEGKRIEDGSRPVTTFSLDLALNILACSLPFSTILILTICAIGDFFIVPSNLLTIGGIFLLFAGLPQLVKRLIRPRSETSYSVVKVGKD